MPVGRFHRVEDRINESEGHGLVEKVAHRVDEYTAWRSPVQRLLEAFGPQRQIEAVLEWMTRHTPEALRKALCITEVATARDFGAPCNRVPRRIGPFDLRTAAHFAHFRTNRKHVPPCHAALSSPATHHNRLSCLRPAHPGPCSNRFLPPAPPPDNLPRHLKPARPPGGGIRPSCRSDRRSPPVRCALARPMRVRRLPGGITENTPTRPPDCPRGRDGVHFPCAGLC